MRRQRRGVILLAVLVVVAILTLIAYRFFNLMNAEHEAAYATNRVTQSRYLADSGLHYAAFVLSYPQTVGLSDAPDESSNLIFPGLAYDNPSVFHLRPVTASGNSQGFFSIVAPRTPDDPQLASARPFRFGVEDEGGKININALLKMDSSGKKLKDMLTKLPNVTPDIADSIISWAQASGTGTSASGDALYYSSLRYAPKYGPYESPEELLFVKGITPRILFGNDTNRNGVLELEEDDGSGAVDRGLSRLLTVYSRERNFDSGGNQRVWINDTDLNNLESNLQTAGVDQDVITFILAYRMYGAATTTMTVRVVTDGSGSTRGAAGAPSSGSGSPRGAAGAPSSSSGTATLAFALNSTQTNETTSQKKLDRQQLDTSKAQANNLQKISSLYDLIDAQVSVPNSSQSGASGGGGGGGQGQQQSTKYNSPLKKSDPQTLRELLPPLLDKASTSQKLDLTPRININTAPTEVLQALPNLADADVQNILDHRPGPDTDPSQGPLYRTPAWLITEAGFDTNVVKQLDSYITTRSQVYRVQVIGYYDQGGPSVRLEAVIDTNNGRPNFLYWRDLTELGRGYDLRTLMQQ
jgi:type II secretory pathway component PulK